MNFARATNQTFVPGLRNLHTKNYAFSTMCEIFTLLSPIISLFLTEKSVYVWLELLISSFKGKLSVEENHQYGTTYTSPNSTAHDHVTKVTSDDFTMMT